MVGQDFFSPGDDRVHYVVVFGDLAGVVEVSEPSQCLVGLIEVVGFVDLVELLEGVGGDLQPWMSLEQPLQVGLVGFGEVVGPA